MRLLHQETYGDGHPTLVFLHYFGGSGRTWRLVINHLSDRFRCKTVDLPGFGSSANMDMGDYTLASAADSLRDSLASLNAGDFVLIGHSMGAKIALQFAAKKPAGLKAMILMAASPPVSEPMKDADRQALKDMYGKPDLIRTHLQKIAHKSIPADVLEQLVEDNLRVNHQAWMAWAEIGSREDITAQVKNIAVPVNFIAGEFDDPLSPDYLKEIASKYFSGSEVCTIPNTAHLLPIEAPTQVAAFISAVAK